MGAMFVELDPRAERLLADPDGERARPGDGLDEVGDGVR